MHPADGFWNFLTVAVAVALLGTPVEVVLAHAVYNRALQYVRHARLNWGFGWIGRYLVQSPIHHRLHHGLEAQYHHCNFSTVPLWDHLFGTWCEAPDRAFAIGVDHPYRHGGSTLIDMWRDYCDMWIVPRRATWAARFGRRLPAAAYRPSPANDAAHDAFARIDA